MADRNRLPRRSVVLVQSEPRFRRFHPVVMLFKLQCIVVGSPYVLNPDASSDVMVLILNSTFQLSRTFLCHGLAPIFFLCVVLKNMENFRPG